MPSTPYFCHQAAGLLQSIIGKAGIATVSRSLLLDITKCVEPPRVLAVDKPLGYPLGEPNNADLQKRIMLAALNLLPRALAEPLTVAFSQRHSATATGILDKSIPLRGLIG